MNRHNPLKRNPLMHSPLIHSRLMPQIMKPLGLVFYLFFLASLIPFNGFSVGASSLEAQKSPLLPDPPDASAVPSEPVPPGPEPVGPLIPIAMPKADYYVVALEHLNHFIEKTKTNPRLQRALNFQSIKRSAPSPSLSGSPKTVPSSDVSSDVSPVTEPILNLPLPIEHDFTGGGIDLLTVHNILVFSPNRLSTITYSLHFRRAELTRRFRELLKNKVIPLYLTYDPQDEDLDREAHPDQSSTKKIPSDSVYVFFEDPTSSQRHRIFPLRLDDFLSSYDLSCDPQNCQIWKKASTTKSPPP